MTKHTNFHGKGRSMQDLGDSHSKLQTVLLHLVALPLGGQHSLIDPDSQSYMVCNTIDSECKAFFLNCFPKSPNFFDALQNFINVDRKAWHSVDFNPNYFAELAKATNCETEQIASENYGLIDTLKNILCELNTKNLNNNEAIQNELLNNNAFLLMKVLLFCQLLNQIQLRQSLYIFYQKTLQVQCLGELLLNALLVFEKNPEIEIEASELLALISRYYLVFSNEILSEVLSKDTITEIATLLATSESDS